jgi:hypothetical protein
MFVVSGVRPVIVMMRLWLEKCLSIRRGHGYRNP